MPYLSQHIRIPAHRDRLTGTPVRKLELDGIGHIGLVLAISRPFRWRTPVLREVEAFIRSVAGG